MRNVRIDTNGEFRCWRCGSKNLITKRTFRSKLLVGVGALLTKKKMKCQACGEYSDTGNAKPYKGPASRRLGKKYHTFTAMHGIKDGVEVEDDDPAEDVPDDDEAGMAVAILRPPPPSVPADWYPDPHGRFELRYHDGARWTDNVSTGGVVSKDPV
jgi:hypothetical protein